MPKKMLKNCSVLDVIEQKMMEKQSILIDGNHIKRIGPVEELSSCEKGLSEKLVFDLNGRTVIPGLIDSHIHLCAIQAPPGETPIELDTVLENLRASETLRILYAAKNAKETLEAGFTTVKDVGSAGDNLALRDGIEKGLIPGPRIVACGWVTQTGGQGELLSSEWVYNVALREADVGVDGPWEIRRKVRKLVGRGYDYIKVFSTGGGYLKHPWHPYWGDRRNFTIEELKALVDEAHAAGRRVAGHAMANVEGIKNAITAGVDTLEHGIFLDDEDVGEMKEKNIGFIPTMAVFERMWGDDNPDDMPYVHIEKEEAERYLDAHQASFQRAYKAGIRIAAGSDTLRVLKHGENACEIVALVKAGMTEMEALASATIHGADALGVGHLVGSIHEGKLADLIVVDPNPLNDISVLCHRKNLKMIIKNGDVVISKL